IVTARYADVAERIAVLSRLLSRTMRAQLEARLDSLAALTNSWAMRRPIELLRAAIQRVDDLVGRLERAPDRQIERSRSLLRETFHKLSLAAPMHRIESAKSQFGQLNLRLAASRPDVRWLPRINYSRGTADQLSQRLLQSALGRMREKSLALTALAGKLESVGPDSVLQRGFSIVTRIKGNKIVTHPDQVRPGQTLRVQSAGGEWRAAALPQGDELFDLG
ncbi:hypothetical protein HY256_09460, partial [Candidatus Sumerlaeota bacterium]|nr:hypothetical protein [Candidatus Sumerlaeota bacterium]